MKDLPYPYHIVQDWRGRVLFVSEAWADVPAYASARPSNHDAMRAAVFADKSLTMMQKDDPMSPAFVLYGNT